MILLVAGRNGAIIWLRMHMPIGICIAQSTGGRLDLVENQSIPFLHSTCDFAVNYSCRSPLLLHRCPTLDCQEKRTYTLFTVIIIY